MCKKYLYSSLGLTTSQRGTEFTKSQFPGLNPYVFSIYRFVVTLYFIVITAWTIAEEYDWTYFIYLTNWTVILVTVYLVVASSNSAKFLIRRHRCDVDDVISSGSSSSVENTLSFVYKLQWVLYYMAASGSILVSLIYWGALYSLGVDLALFTDLNVHAFTSLLMIVETFLSATPVRLLHMVYPLAYVIIYVVFTLVFWAVDCTVIYPIIDYNTDPGFAVLIVVGVLTGVVICHVLIWLIGKLRIMVLRKCFKTENTRYVE
ncbi:protein rolling stone-like [Anneissia japonica]|uniref:protein rolling stone-like n=1 Tax=Anneissia japonica TaxID=1529436 RepID=UPI001425B145|nr:protein rolling stone-like [Anneissia japonica]